MSTSKVIELLRKIAKAESATNPRQAKTRIVFIERMRKFGKRRS